VRAWLFAQPLVLGVLWVGGGWISACSGLDSASAPHRDAPSLGELRLTSEAGALAGAIRREFPAAFTERGAPGGATVELPVSAARPLRLTDDASAITVSIALEGVRDVLGGRVGDTAVYPGAAPSRGDLLYRIFPGGVEDLVYYRDPPAKQGLRYRVDLGDARGLRLVEGVLEILDSGGAPVLRVEPPCVFDVGGRHPAVLHVEGCAVDRSPRAPFRRPVVPAGATRCMVEVDWSAARVRYPALVDPIWSPTFNVMFAARTSHTLTLLEPASKTSLALVAGGFATEGGVPLKSAEIYDPLSRRFSVTGSMTTARGAHTATLLVPPSPSGSGVVVAGGADAVHAPIDSLEVYDPASGVFITDSHFMAAPRFNHAAAPTGDAEVLFAGGTAPPLNQPTKTAYLYTFNGFVGAPPSNVNSVLTLLPALMGFPRSALTATRLTTGKVLLAGGFVLGGGGKLVALNSAEIFDPGAPAASMFQAVAGGMTSARGYHTATRLGDSGKVLIVGGTNATVGGFEAASGDVFSDGSNEQAEGFVVAAPIAMATARSNHTATLLPDGRVLVAGGFNQGTALGSAEVFSPLDGLFHDLGAVPAMLPRGNHAAVLVNAGDWEDAGHTVLVTGGAGAPGNGTVATNNAQIMFRINGDACTMADECLSGYCVDGVCCNEACDTDCFACSVDQKESNDAGGECGPSKVGSEPRIQCVSQILGPLQQTDVEVHSQCDGMGSVEQTNDTKVCTPAVCGQNNLCSTGCASTANCALSGWCDTTIPSPAGDLGTCVDKKAESLACAADDECISDHCVDGVCCESLCGLQCQACDVVGFLGQCRAVGSSMNPENVHIGTALHPRTSCMGFASGVENACAGYCDGSTPVDTCQYPDASVVHGADDCADDLNGAPSALVRHPCDSSGSFIDEVGDCGGFKCADAHACKTICTLDDDCIGDHICDEGVCVLLEGPLCDGERTLRRPKAQKGNILCDNYLRCPNGAHECLTECRDVTDCIPVGAEMSLGCTSDGRCIEQRDVQTVPVPFCNVAQPGEPVSGRSLGLFILALGAVASRIRRGRRPNALCRSTASVINPRKA
jgi:hypothetical protein